MIALAHIDALRCHLKPMSVMFPTLCKCRSMAHLDYVFNIAGIKLVRIDAKIAAVIPISAQS